MGDESYFNVDAALACQLPDEQYKLLYRGQPYSKNKNEQWGPVNFTRKVLDNRFTPAYPDVCTAYLGANKITCFLEVFPLFRQRDLSALEYRFPIGKSELLTLEMITFSLDEPLNLVCLTDEFAYIRHRVKGDIVTSVDLTEANNFAGAVYQHSNHDGLIYRTRQGGSRAIVVFDRAADKLRSVNIIERQSFFDAAMEEDDIESKLSIQIIDDM